MRLFLTADNNSDDGLYRKWEILRNKRVHKENAREKKSRQQQRRQIWVYSKVLARKSGTGNLKKAVQRCSQNGLGGKKKKRGGRTEGFENEREREREREL